MHFSSPFSFSSSFAPHRKLEDWNSDSDSESQKGASTSTSIDLKAKTVILSRMFTLAELEQEPELLLDLKEDVREECETFGNVSVVKIWDVSKMSFLH